MDENQEIPEEIGEEFVGEDMQHHDLLELFDSLSPKEKFKKFVYGLSQSKDTGAYKWSQLQLVRLSAPVSAFVIPIVLFALLMVLAGTQQKQSKKVNVKIQKEKPVEKLDKKIEFDEEPIKPPKPVDIDFTSDQPLSVDVQVPTPSAEVSPMPATMDTVAQIKSPVKMRGIFGSRSGSARGAALKKYGGTGITEGAVLRALRWLKLKQNKDGSWPKTREAMTGLALLTFLAHGETPSSEEFGPTVEKAIKYLVNSRDAAGGWNRRYEHAICTYALCEAYALTRVPMLKDVCTTAVKIIIKGQNPTGGWRYSFKPPDKDDTSVSGWCIQALKAAKMAGIKTPQLHDAIKLAIMGLQKNASPTGGFGYTGPGKTGLSGVGVLCMQLLGAANKSECKKGLDFLDTWTYSWEKPQGPSPIYYWYYITQSKFHAGGKRWDHWNAVFAKELVKNQQIKKDAIADTKGVMKDVGHWVSPSKTEHDAGNVVMDTCLSALQLQVYYRYLPTFKKDAVLEDDVSDAGEGDDDLNIQIDI